MSFDFFKTSDNYSMQNNQNIITPYSKTKNTKFNADISKLNKNLTKLSKKIRSETVLISMIKLIMENRDRINITNSILTINAEDLDLIQKLNFCMEVLTHIPFSFQYDKQQTKILLDFFHLEEEINLITNMEI